MNPETFAWLRELHRQWQIARGGKLQPSTRPFSRRWEDLLDAAELRTAADRTNAEHEAEALETQGHIRLRRHRYRRHLVESIDLPVSSEPWLIGLFGGTSAQDLQHEAITIVAAFQSAGHPRWPESWRTLCDTVLAGFAEGRNLPPFVWKAPAELRTLLATLFALTAREWPSGTLIRDASTALGLESKALEKKTRVLESALSALFGEETTLEALGLIGSQSRTMLHGRLRLHFADGTTQNFEHLRSEFTISLPDLQRATHASTSADQILSIENAKTTFRQAVAANSTGDTLLVATSFPNAATRRLLEILPPELPHHHFGDTDASGYAILRSLRETGIRPVNTFLMDWRDKADSAPLSEHDKRLLPTLKTSPLLADCHAFLVAMETAGCKGAFEQESRGAPNQKRWPFWSEWRE